LSDRSDEQAVPDAEQALQAAMLASDVEQLDRLLHPELLAVGPDGSLVGKPPTSPRTAPAPSGSPGASSPRTSARRGYFVLVASMPARPLCRARRSSGAATVRSEASAP
jgi:hypothetical protein